MECSDSSRSPAELARRVQVRIGWRVRNLIIEVHPEQAILRGQATTSVARELAQHVVGDFLPHVRLENTIVVEDPDEILHGMPLH